MIQKFQVQMITNPNIPKMFSKDYYFIIVFTLMQVHMQIKQTAHRLIIILLNQDGDAAAAKIKSSQLMIYLVDIW